MSRSKKSLKRPARAASGSLTSGRSIRIEWCSVIAMSCGSRGPGQVDRRRSARIDAVGRDHAVAHVRRLHRRSRRTAARRCARRPWRARRPRSAACRRSPPRRASRASPGRARRACRRGTRARAAARCGRRESVLAVSFSGSPGGLSPSGSMIPRQSGAAGLALALEAVGADPAVAVGRAPVGEVHRVHHRRRRRTSGSGRCGSSCGLGPLRT